MYLSHEQLTILFNHYLKSFVIPGSVSHHPIFNTIAGGNALTRRIYAILRDPKLSYLVVGDHVDILGLFNYMEKYMSKNPKIFIIGLNHWFTIQDVKVLRKLFELNFIK